MCQGIWSTLQRDNDLINEQWTIFLENYFSRMLKCVNAYIGLENLGGMDEYTIHFFLLEVEILAAFTHPEQAFFRNSPIKTLTIIFRKC